MHFSFTSSTQYSKTIWFNTHSFNDTGLEEFMWLLGNLLIQANWLLKIYFNYFMQNVLKQQAAGN